MGFIAFGALLLIIIVAEFLYIKYNGQNVPAPEIPRQAQQLGSGKKLTYVVMGDSTSIGQGAAYKDSYAYISAQYLAQKYEVTLVNTGVSGARTVDVLNTQLEKAVAFKPDIALIAIGANDATHFTKGSSLQDSMQKIVDGLRKSNSDMQIIVTGSPAVDSVRRFPIGAKQLMHLRTNQVNNAFEPIIRKNNLLVAPIAQETRAAFLADPTLTAADNFHPNGRGYALWVPVITKSLDKATNKLSNF